VRERPEVVEKRALQSLGVARRHELTLRAAEEAHIVRVLRACDGRRTAAARLLGVPRRTLQRKLRTMPPSKLVGLAPKMGSGRRVAKKKKKPGTQRHGPAPRISGAQVLRLRASGVTWAKIAEELQCSAAGALLAAKRAESEGVSVRPKTPWAPIDGARAAKMRARGETWSRIADELGCSALGAKKAAERASAKS
jgi:hypothetical protein